MIAFAVATFHAPRLPAGTERVDAVVWVKPAGVPDAGAEASLRIWTPAGAHVCELREIDADADLLTSATAIDARTAAYDAGRWSDEVREFALAIAVPPCADGDELLAARVTVLAGGAVAGRATIAVGFGGGGVPAPATAVSAGAPPIDITQLPTGRSPWPRHTEPSAYAGQACPDCGEQTYPDDRYCEGCGRALVSDPAH